MTVCRRYVVGSLTLSACALFLPAASRADDCPWVQAAIQRAKNDLADIDGWVATQGVPYVKKLKNELAALEAKTSDRSATLDASGDLKAAVIDDIEAIASIGMALVGIGLLPLTAASTILISFSVSTTLLIARFALVPSHVDGVETATLRTVGDVEYAIEGVKDGGAVTIATRTSLEYAGRIIGVLDAIYAVCQAFSAHAKLASTEEKLQKLQKLRASAKALSQEIGTLALPGNLRVMREKQLEGLIAVLNSLAQGCTSSRRLP